MDTLLEELRRCLDADQLVALATVVAGPKAGARLLVWPDRSAGELGAADLDRQVLAFARALLVSQQNERRTFVVGGVEYDVFVAVFPPSPHLIIVGAVHIAIPLVTFARVLGFRTTVIDPRPAFATPDRFSHADRLLIDWPDEALPTLALNEGSYVAVLSHDDKLDVPALAVALNSPARYIGALGSRKTMAQRAEKLRALGISEAQVARVHNPIGLDLGGRQPEEMALAIMAEIVAARNGKM